MIFQTSQVVETLVGYQRDKNGMMILSAPIWMEFDENNLSDTHATICRLRYLEVPQIGIIPLQMFRLPVVNSTFIICERPLDQRPVRSLEDATYVPLDSDKINNINSRNEISKNIQYARSNIVTQIKSKDSFSRMLSGSGPQGGPGPSVPLTDSPQETVELNPKQQISIDMSTPKRKSRRRAPSSRRTTVGPSTGPTGGGGGGGYSGGGGSNSGGY